MADHGMEGLTLSGERVAGEKKVLSTAGEGKT